MARALPGARESPSIARTDSPGAQPASLSAANAASAGCEGEDRFLVMRYSGRFPMVGIRVQDVFHVLRIEAAFGDVYNHG